MRFLGSGYNLTKPLIAALLAPDTHPVSREQAADTRAFQPYRSYRPSPGEKVAVILCGANTNPSDLMASVSPAEVQLGRVAIGE